MSKHTPGPWSINHSNCDIEAEDGGISICYPFDSGTAIGNANARLIAAAPDLLEALKKMLDEHYYQIGYDMTIDNPTCVAAVSAIAKATGETK